VIGHEALEGRLKRSDSRPSGNTQTSSLGKSSLPRLWPTLVINPADDLEFARLARSLVENGTSPEGLERLLSRRFPHVAVHRRELSSERIEIWYVYRDGRWKRSGGDSAGSAQGE